MEGDENWSWGGGGVWKTYFWGRSDGVMGMNFWVVVDGGRGGVDFAFLVGWECP